MAVSVGGHPLALSSLFSSNIEIDSIAFDALSDSCQCIEHFEGLSADPIVLDSDQSRACLIALLNWFLMISKGIRPILVSLIAKTLNQGFDSKALDWGSVSGFLNSFLKLNDTTIEDTGITDDEFRVLNRCLNEFVGIRGSLAYWGSRICKEVDLVAALSCEASGLDLSVVLHVEAHDVKEKKMVAKDLKSLTMGSALVGAIQYDGLSNIAQVHGVVRKSLLLAQAETIIALNTTHLVDQIYRRDPRTWYNEAVWLVTFPSMASSWLHLCQYSLERSKLICDTINDAGVMDVFERYHTRTDSMTVALSEALSAALNGKYFRYLEVAYEVLVHVRKVIAWEGALALIQLEKIQGVQDIIGKGTGVLRQLMFDDFRNEDGELVQQVDRLTLHILSFFDKKASDPDAFLSKVKDVVKGTDLAGGLHCDDLLVGRAFDKRIVSWKQRAMSTITRVFEEHGATGILPLELRSTPNTVPGSDRCLLRYKRPIPFARYIASNNVTSCKKYLICPCSEWYYSRMEQCHDFKRCDFDIVGNATTEAMGPDCEVLEVLMTVLGKLNIVDYEIKLNHSKLLAGMLEIWGVPAEKFRMICSSIYKLDKKSFEQIKKKMVEKGLAVEIAERIGSFVKKRGPPFQILSELRQEGSKFIDNRESALALKDLEILFNHLEKNNCLHRVVFDLSFGLGLRYYTGLVFEVALKGAKQVAIAAGGRYDNLIAKFGLNWRKLSVIGVSFHVHKIFTFMDQQLVEPQENGKTEAEILMNILVEDSYVEAKVKEYYSGIRWAEYQESRRKSASEKQWLDSARTLPLADEPDVLDASQEGHVPCKTLKSAQT